jgi:hypothetical protein
MVATVAAATAALSRGLSIIALLALMTATEQGQPSTGLSGHYLPIDDGTQTQQARSR